MSSIQEQYERAWHQKFGRGGTHEHRGPYARRGSFAEETGMVVRPMPSECPRCGDMTNWCAVDEMYSRFVCRDCWHAWGTEKETQPHDVDGCRDEPCDACVQDRVAAAEAEADSRSDR